jgi:hypothetical protein
VRITDDSDGAVTFLGLGDGDDEDLTMNLDDTANTVVFSSSTGVNLWTLSGINLSVGTSGVLTTGTVELGAAADTTLARSGAGAVTIEGNQIILSGHTFSGDVTATLGAAGTSVLTIADNSVDGTDIALGSDAAGDVMYYDGTNWVRLAKGTAGQVLEINAGATAPEWGTDDGSAALTDTLVGYGSTMNVLTGEAAFSYNATTNTLSVDNLAISSILTVDTLNAGAFLFEGATADANETTLNVVDPTADRTINLPNASGTVALAEIVVKSTAANYTIGTTDPRELYGGVIYVTAAATLTIPAVAAGASFTVITIGAVAVSVDPNAADLIYLDGVALSDGDKITNTSTAGDIAVLTYYDATGWVAITNSWTDGN